MIDNKQIEEVAKIYMIGEFYDRDEAEWNYPTTNEEKRNQCIIDFIAGAKWAINEFLKDLWHQNPCIYNDKGRCDMWDELSVPDESEKYDNQIDV